MTENIRALSGLQALQVQNCLGCVGAQAGVRVDLLLEKAFGADALLGSLEGGDRLLVTERAKLGNGVLAVEATLSLLEVEQV